MAVASKPTEVSLPPTRGSVRQAASFARDPAVFTAGPGLALGDFYRLRLPGYDLHVVTHPALAEEILVRQGEAFEKSRLYWGELRRIIGDGMGSLEGDRWRHLRKLEQPYFAPRVTEGYLPTASSITRSELDDLYERCATPLTLHGLEIHARLNTRLVLALFFGREEPPHTRAEITRRIVDGEDTIAWRSKFPWRRVTGWFNGRNLRARGHRAFFQRYADALEASPDSRDPSRLVGALCRMRADPSAPRYSHELLRNELIVHLGASTETQGVAEGWCMYLLWRHPHVLERLREEVDRVAGTVPVGIEHLSALRYALQVIRETLRLFPTAYGVVRDCVVPTELFGYPARPRQVFFIALPGLHRTPRFWSDPNEFRPERFRTDRLPEIDRHLYMPFGAGRHVCIGQHLALPTMTLAMAQLAQRFDWSFEEAEVGWRGRATLRPRGGFRLTVGRRTRR